MPHRRCNRASACVVGHDPGHRNKLSGMLTGAWNQPPDLAGGRHSQKVSGAVLNLIRGRPQREVSGFAPPKCEVSDFADCDRQLDPHVGGDDRWTERLVEK
eukprot:COSAG02_NODE_1412_length_12756_cov_57.891048_1_plen_101_part_00